MEHNKDPASEYARFHMRRATAGMLENIGFTSVSQISLDTLSSITRKYFEKLCRDAANRANHAGRTGVTLNDVSHAFDENHVSVPELHDYLRSVGNFAVDQQVPRFPVRLTEEEDATLDEKGKPRCAVVASTSVEYSSTDSTALRARVQQQSAAKKQREVTRPRIPTFPSFDGMRAADLGFEVLPETDDAREGKNRRRRGRPRKQQSSSLMEAPEVQSSLGGNLKSKTGERNADAIVEKENKEEKHLGAMEHPETPTAALRLRNRTVPRPCYPIDKELDEGGSP